MQKKAWKLQFYFRAEDRKKFREPGRMRGPGRRSDEVAVGDGIGHGEIDVDAAGLGDVGADGGIGAALFPLKHASGGEDLRGMTDGGNRLAPFGKVANDFDDTRIEANVFRRPSTWKDEGVILFSLDLVESGVESKIVSALFGVGLVAFEIMDGGANELTGLFSRANRVNGVAHHQQRLERDHHFVVFHVVADDHEDGFLRHGVLRNVKRISEIKMPTEGLGYMK